jgi:hypothetical protein
LNIPQVITRRWPDLATALDEARMRDLLRTALFGRERPQLVVERCTPDKPVVVPGECCTLQYDFLARDLESGRVVESLVLGRLFADRQTARAYMERKLAPLLARARGRADLAAFAEPAAMVEPLPMIVHVWPLDGELPGLLDATDPEQIVEILGDALAPGLAVEACRTELVLYRRRQRCVLRYSVSGRTADGDQVTRIVYGKLAPSTRTVGDGRYLGDLRAHLAKRDRNPIRVPRSLGWRPELGLALLEEVPGKSSLGSVLRASVQGRPKPDAPALDNLLMTSARVAATLHTSGLALGPTLTLEDRLASLERDVETTERLLEGPNELARAWLERLAELAGHSVPFAPCLCHGDFKYAQLLFDGPRCGLVDLDTLAQAEPGLDLGHFLAHLRTQVRRVSRREGLPASQEPDLGERFLRAYIEAMGDRVEDEDHLRARVEVYELASLLQLVLHGRLKFDEERLEDATALIEERLARLPSARRRRTGTIEPE